MVKLWGKSGIDKIIDLTNKIIVGVIPVEWEISTITLSNDVKKKVMLHERQLYRAEINKCLLTEFPGMLLCGRKGLLSRCIGM